MLRPLSAWRCRSHQFNSSIAALGICVVWSQPCRWAASLKSCVSAVWTRADRRASAREFSLPKTDAASRAVAVPLRRKLLSAFLVFKSFFFGVQIFIAFVSSSKPRYSSLCVGVGCDFASFIRAPSSAKQSRTACTESAHCFLVSPRIRMSSMYMMTRCPRACRCSTTLRYSLVMKSGLRLRPNGRQVNT